MAEPNLKEYFSECQNIQDSLDENEITEEDVLVAVNDDEQASEFLQSVGFSEMVLAIREGKFLEQTEINDCELNLTPKQVATINRRLDTVRQKVRPHRPDVRNLFSSQTENENEASKTKAKIEKPDGRQSPFYIPTPDYPRVGESLLKSGLAIVHPDGIFSEVNHLDTSIPVFFDKMDSQKFSRHSVISVGDEISSGITHIDDLGKKDMKKLEVLAQIELLALFDEYKINYTRCRTKKRGKDQYIYGVALHILLERDCRKDPNIQVPSFFQKLINHLEMNCLNEEGLLRVPGALARIKELRNEIDSNWNKGKYSLDDVRPHDAAGLLKLFLRELPSPLLTSEWVDAFFQISKIPDLTRQVFALSLLTLVLPELNRNVLKMLLSFLSKVSANENNRMNQENVAMVIAPNLFLLGSGGSRNKPTSMDQELQLAASSTNVTLLMMQHQEEIFIVPPGLISQIRQKNEEVRRPMIKRLVGGRKDKMDLYKPTQQVMISVAMHHQSSGDVSMELKENTTAGDVVLQMSRSPRMDRRSKGSSGNLQNSNSQSELTLENANLYEIGGNIGERRLDHSTNLMSVCHINPNAKYVVRMKPH